MTQEQHLIESLSGIRGIFGQGLDTELAQQYAHAHAQYLQKEHATEIAVVVGGDTRSSSQELMQTFAQVYASYGFTVHSLGFTTTPIAQYAVRHFSAHGGVMITASHNPPEFNGWKLLQQDGAVLNVQLAQQIIDTVHAGVDAQHHDEHGEIVDASKQATQSYVKWVLDFLGKDAINDIHDMKLSLVADPNGSAVIDPLQQVCDALGITLIGIHTTLGVFERVIEPTVKTLEHLIPVVDQQRAAFACGFDADADRVEIVLPNTTEFAKHNGPAVSGNYLMALGVDSVLGATNKPAPVVVNIATSHMVHEVARKYNAEVVEVDVGETNVVVQMQKLGSLIGGEGSNGGIIVGDTTCRDGIMSIVLLLQLMARTKKTLDELLIKLTPYYEERHYPQCDPEKGDTTAQALLDHFKTEGYTVVAPPSTVGGFKVIFDEHSMLYFRASATEPGLFRIIANSSDKDQVTQMIAMGKEVFNKVTA